MKKRKLMFYAGMSILLLGLIYLCRIADASEFSDANADYQKGDFKAASASYDRLIAAGKPTAAMYFNAANAHFKAGNKGKAALNYRRAFRIAPRDKDIQWNRDVLRTVLYDRIDAKEGLWLSAYIHRVIDQVTVDEINLVFTSTILFFLVLSLLMFVAGPLKAVLNAMRVLAVILFLILGTLFIFKWMDVKDPRVIVLDKEVTARYGPSARETTAFLLHEGAEGKVLDQVNDWIFIGLKNGNSGWIPKSSCEVV